MIIFASLFQNKINDFKFFKYKDDTKIYKLV